MKAKRGDKALVLVFHANTALQHPAVGKVAACFREHRPITIDDDGRVQPDLLLLAECRIGCGRGQVQIAEIDD